VKKVTRKQRPTIEELEKRIEKLEKKQRGPAAPLRPEGDSWVPWAYPTPCPWRRPDPYWWGVELSD
jgi:hypothetical protein